MVLGGLQKLTLLDYPAHVACTIFTVGCNLRCPFCHNAPLVIPGQTPPIEEEEIFRFLEKRRGILDGVVVSGGEPLLQNDIEPFLERIKRMGFAVKLDTNGVFHERLARILKSGLVDYVAMDVKNAKEKYELTAGAGGILPSVEKSVQLLLEGGTPYEFRTTAVKELHEPEDFRRIGEWIAGAERYFIQQFIDSGNLLKGGFTTPTEREMQAYLESVTEFVPAAKLRGVS